MLNNKQKAYLKSLANKEKAIYQIGKDGLTDNLYQGVNNYLDAHELIKINLLKSCPVDTNEAAINLTVNCSAEVVQIIGRCIILYRKSKKALIELP